jgi:hypothetical protein
MGMLRYTWCTTEHQTSEIKYMPADITSGVTCRDVWNAALFSRHDSSRGGAERIRGLFDLPFPRILR